MDRLDGWTEPIAILSTGSSPIMQASVWWPNGKCTIFVDEQPKSVTAASSIAVHQALQTVLVGISGMSRHRRRAPSMTPHTTREESRSVSRWVSHLLAAATPEQIGLAPDHNHVVPGPRRRRAPAGFQLSPLAMTISVTRSFSVGSVFGHLLHAALHTVYRRVLGPHAVGNNSRCTAGGTQTGALWVCTVSLQAR